MLAVQKILSYLLSVRCGPLLIIFSIKNTSHISDKCVYTSYSSEDNVRICREENSWDVVMALNNMFTTAVQLHIKYRQI
jgi:hypothetical protein